MYGGLFIRVDGYSHLDSLQMRPFDDIDHRRQSSVPMASLGTCRQIYHDAKDAFYSANVFQVYYDPKPVGVFIRHLECVSHRALAVRNMDLHVLISSRNQEREWDNGFCALAENLKNVRHISISIYVDECYGFGNTRPESLAYRKVPFLPGLLEWKKLPLKIFTLLVDGQLGKSRGGKNKYIWTAVQKREYVQYVKGAILGLD